MKNVLISIIIICMPVMVNAKPPTCKQQIQYLKQSLKNLQDTIAACDKDWDGTCNAAISVNHEAILNGLDYASQICPAEWTEKLERIKEKMK